MFPHIHDKRQWEVDYYRWSESDEWGVNEKQPDAWCCNTQELADLGTHAERMCLKKMSDFVHHMRSINYHFDDFNSRAGWFIDEKQLLQI